MDPITIGVAIAGAKKLLESATDIKEIAGSIENLFSHTEKAQKPRKIDPNVDETSISVVAADIIAEKNNKVALKNLAIDLDAKFGFGTFELIKEERSKRVEARKARIKSAKGQARAKKARYMFWLRETSKLVVLLSLIAIPAYIIYANRCTEGAC
tara:strand:- start:1251 stop:1715 length:465 start_codon:yes stop_codon:yes gene_type:complete